LLQVLNILVLNASTTCSSELFHVLTTWQLKLVFLDHTEMIYLTAYNHDL